MGKIFQPAEEEEENVVTVTITKGMTELNVMEEVLSKVANL